MSSTMTPDGPLSESHSGIGSGSESELDNYELKLRLQQLNQELREFQESSHELEQELEQELEEGERRQKRLEDKIEELMFVNKELKKKAQEHTQEMAKTQLTFQKEITSVREAYKLVKDRLREIEMENDNMEQHERITKSSLEDLEQKYNLSLETIAMLEAELASKEIIDVDLQRTKEELRDVNEEMNFNKLKLAEKTAEVDELYIQLNTLKKIPQRAYRSFSYQEHEQTNPVHLLSTASGTQNSSSNHSTSLLLPMAMSSIPVEDEPLTTSTSVSRHMSNSRSMRRIQGIMEQTKTLEKTLSSFKFYLPKPMTPSKYKPGRSGQVRPRIVTSPVSEMGELVNNSRLVSPATIAMTSTQVTGDLFTPEHSPQIHGGNNTSSSISGSGRIRSQSVSVTNDHPEYFSFVPKSDGNNVTLEGNNNKNYYTDLREDRLAYNSGDATLPLHRNQSLSRVSLRRTPSVARDKLIELQQSPQMRKLVDNGLTTSSSNYKDGEIPIDRGLDYRSRWSRSLLNFGGLVGTKTERGSSSNSRQSYDSNDNSLSGHTYSNTDDSDREEDDGEDTIVDINFKWGNTNRLQERKTGRGHVRSFTSMDIINPSTTIDNTITATTNGRGFFGRYLFGLPNKEDGDKAVLSSESAMPLPLPCPTSLSSLPGSTSVSASPTLNTGALYLAPLSDMGPPPNPRRKPQSERPQAPQSSEEPQPQASQSQSLGLQVRKSRSVSPFKRKGKVYSHTEMVDNGYVLPPPIPAFRQAMTIPKSPHLKENIYVRDGDDNNNSLDSLSEGANVNVTSEFTKVWSSLPNPPRLPPPSCELNGSLVGIDSSLGKKGKRSGPKSRDRLVGDNEFARQFERGTSGAIGHGKFI